MIDNTTNLQGLIYVLGDNTTLGPSKYVLAYQNAPQPDLPYSSITTKSLTKVGMDVLKDINTITGYRDIVSQYKWEVRFDVFGDNSVGLAQEILFKLNLETIRDLLKEEGYNILRTTTIESAPYLVDNLWRDRAYFLATFVVPDKNTEFVSWIEHMGPTVGQFLRGPNDPAPFTETFTIN
jgi:hypothetical protein